MDQCPEAGATPFEHEKGGIIMYKAFDLSGKVVLITGGNSGIGLAMAEAVAMAGADVCIWGTNAEKNVTALKRLEELGGHHMALRCNVADEQEVEEAFEETVKAFGQVDACFANAGVSGRRNVRSFVEMTTEEWRRVLSVNLDGTFFTLRAAARHMVSRQGGGSLVATASLAAIEGQARGEHYAATKGGTISIMRSLAVELARHGVRANVILPGWIDTAMTEKTLSSEPFQKKVITRIPFRRWGGPGDFGGIAVYLVSDASAYHTGDTFVIDGGYAVF
jgi:NAD(P)-dependent dehydrogenase (short-subunit alcohol dehydrogenase family)